MALDWKSNPMWYLVVALCAALLLPALFMDGMFIDGLLYASVAKNYAIGNGTFWNMQFSEIHHKEFHEQPPLMFFLQGMFFKIFGLSLYTERIYCLVAAVINAWLISRAWKIVTKDATTSWLPVLFWFVMPVTFWAFTNNVEECTMSIFAMLAMNAILRALFNDAEKNHWWIIAGLWILLAGLTKGVQGMFLLASPLWALLILQKGSVKDFLRRCVLIAIVPAIFVLIAWFTPTIHDSFDAYFTSRFGKTFSNVTANTDSRFHILFELLLDILPVIFLVAVFFATGRNTPGLRSVFRSGFRTRIFFAVCALSGILPLMVTLEQRGFYLVTALPMVAMAFALPLLPVAQRVNAFFSKRKSWSIAFTSMAAIGFVVVIFLTIKTAGQPKRDADKIEALQEVASYTGENTLLTADNYWNGEWSFLCYAQRFHGLSFTTYGHRPDVNWQLRPKGESPPSKYFIVIPLKTPLFDLYKRKYYPEDELNLVH